MDEHYDWSTLEKITCFTRQYIWQMEEDGEFPPRTRMGARRIAWEARLVHLWLEWRKRLQARAETIAKEIRDTEQPSMKKKMNNHLTRAWKMAREELPPPAWK